MNIEYKTNIAITEDQFIDLLKESTLAERRPIHDRDCMKGAIENADLSITAWTDGKLIGIARSVTDHHYACYLSDLAVHKQYQKKGIGKQLIRLTQNQLGSQCMLILLAAPAANTYYEPLGFKHNLRCWVLESDQRITDKK